MRKVKIIIFGAAMGIILAAFLMIMLPIKVTTVISDSMYPTLATNDRVLISTNQPFDRGSVVAFYKVFYEQGERYDMFLVKRIAGVAGDHLLADGKKWYCNGVPGGPCPTKFDLFVPDGKLFMIGDNSSSSSDSRLWSDPFADENKVIGVVTRKLWSFEEVQ